MRKPLRRFVAMVLIGAGVRFAVPSTASGAQAERTLAIGVYRGPGPWGAALIGEYEQRMHVSVDYAVDYQDVDSWDNQTWPAWQADAWRQQKRTVVLGGTGVFPEGGSWGAAARGDYDSHWRVLGERLVASGQAGAILRGAHEFNGAWFHYKVTPADTANFITAWRRWVDVMRSVPGQRFTFDWNPIIGIEQLHHPDEAYPGDAWVDRIALDVYDGYYGKGWDPALDPEPTEFERNAVWDQIVNGERGLRFWRTFAAARAKPLSFPEWGLRTWRETDDGKSHGGGDNPTFISRMNAIITDPAWNVAYHAPWEDPGFGLSDPDDHPKRQHGVTEARSRYLSLNWRSGPPATSVRPVADAASGVDTDAVPSRPVRVVGPPVPSTATAPKRAAKGVVAYAFGSTPGVVGGVAWSDLRSPHLVSNGYLVCDHAAPLRPSPPASIAPLLGCGVYQRPLDIRISSVQNGTYDAYLTVWENDFPESYSITLQGAVVVANRNSVGAGVWARLGPFRVQVQDHSVRLGSQGWLSNLSGLELRPVATTTTRRR